MTIASREKTFAPLRGQPFPQTSSCQQYHSRELQLTTKNKELSVWPGDLPMAMQRHREEKKPEVLAATSPVARRFGMALPRQSSSF